MNVSTHFLKATFTYEERKDIATKIKNISEDIICYEMDKLIQIGENAQNMSPRILICKNIVLIFMILLLILMNLRKKNIYKIC